MSRPLWIVPLVAAALIAVGARGESPSGWSLHASVRWDLGYIRDVDFVGDTGLALALEPARGAHELPGFIVWDPETKRVEREIPADIVGMTVHAVSADGSRIAGAGATRVKVWDAATGAELLVVGRSGFRRPGPSAVALSRDGSRLAVAVGGRNVAVWDVLARKRLLTAHGDPFSECVGITPNGEVLVAAGVQKHRVRTWDVASGKELDAYGGYKRRVRAIVFGESRRTMVTGSGDGVVTIWDLVSGRRTHRFAASEDPVASLAIDRDETVVAVGDVRGGASMWDIASDPPVGTHYGSRDAPRRLRRAAPRWSLAGRRELGRSVLARGGRHERRR